MAAITIQIDAIKKMELSIEQMKFYGFTQNQIDIIRSSVEDDIQKEIENLSMDEILNNKQLLAELKRYDIYLHIFDKQNMTNKNFESLLQTYLPEYKNEIIQQIINSPKAYVSDHVYCNTCMAQDIIDYINKVKVDKELFICMWRKTCI